MILDYYISGGKVIYPADSLFKVINLFGDVSGGAKKNMCYQLHDMKQRNVSSTIESMVLKSRN
jgi:hypothetical protein